MKGEKKIENIPLFTYFGNKDKEMHIIKENVPDMNNIDIIIEPYCGSFALIRYLTSIYPNKKYICNDNDEMLIKTYNALQDDNICNELVEFFKTFEVKDKVEYDKFKKEKSIKSYLFTHIIYNIRNGLYDKNKRKMNERDINKLIFFNKTYKNIEFVCDDAANIINKYINNEKAFLFLDPPFLLTSLSFYESQSKNLISFFESLKEINDKPSKILAICGDNFLLDYFYEKHNIKIKFETTIFYRGQKSKEHKNIYVSNY